LAVETKLVRLAVETKLVRLAVETKLVRLAVETKLVRLAVDTKLVRLAVETKLVRLAVETKLVRLAVETKLARLGVETKLAKLGVETTPETDEIYPIVPKPVTVDVRFNVVIPPPDPDTKALFNNKVPLLTVKKLGVPKKGSNKLTEDTTVFPELIVFALSDAARRVFVLIELTINEETVC